MSLAEGRRLGPFTLLRFLAQGGMGQVWEARDEELRRNVALKLVLPGRVDTRSLELFAREARAGGSLNHPSLVTTLAFGNDDGFAWIAQELVEGAWTLKDALDELRGEDQVPSDYYRDLAELVVQVADGLEVAHAAGVIHRDIKPQNILITPDGAPKVADFGLARVIDDSFLSVTGEFAGTYAYMSPEQVTAKRMGLDHRTDMFSLGVVLYELLTLRRPFEGDTTHQIAEQIITHDPPEPFKLRSQCPRDLAVICGKAIEKAPSRRYASMAELAADLRRFLRHEPILARPAGPLARAGKWGRRHPAISLASAVAAVLLVVISILGVMQVESARLAEEKAGEVVKKNLELEQVNDELTRSNSDKDDALARLAAQTELTQRRTYSAFLHEAQLALGAGNIEEAARLHARCPEPQRDWEWGHLGLMIDPLPNGPLLPDLERAWIEDFQWSPDGDRALVVTDGGALHAWDWGSGEEAFSLAPETGHITRARWDPSGSRIAAVDDRGVVRIVSTIDGAVLDDFQAQIDEDVWLSWSPDSSWLAVRSFDTGHVGVWSAEDLEPFLSVPAGAVGWATPGLSWNPLGTAFATLSGTGSFEVWDLLEREMRFTVAAHEEPIDRLLWSPTGELIATASSKGHQTRVWDAGSGDFVTEFAFGGSGVYMDVLTWGPSGSRLLSTTDGLGHWEIWDARSGESRVTPSASMDDLTSLVWNPGGDLIAAGNGDGVLQLWDAASGELQATSVRPDEAILALHWSPDGTRLVANDEFEDASWWETAVRADTQVLEEDGTTPNCLAFSPVGDRLLVGTGSGTIRELDSMSFQATRVISPSTDDGSSVSALTWNPGGTRFASLTSAGQVQVWDARTFEPIWSVDVDHARRLEGLEWSPDGTRLALDGRSIDGELLQPARLLDAGSGEVLMTLEGCGRLALWSPDGSKLASCDREGSALLIVDASTGAKLQTLGVPTEWIDDAAWHPDGQRLVTAEGSGPLRIWNVETGEELSELSGPAQDYERVSWSPNGRRLVASLDDLTLRVRDVETEETLQILTGHGSWIRALAWSPDGQRLVSAEADGPILSWQSTRPDALEHLRAETPRRRVRSFVDELFDRHLLLRPVLEAIASEDGLSASDRKSAALVATGRGDTTASALRQRAWPLVDPRRTDRTTDAEYGLQLLRLASELTPKSAWIRAHTSWAYFAVGRYEEAVREMELAIGMLPAEASVDDPYSYSWHPLLTDDQNITTTYHIRKEMYLDLLGLLQSMIAEAEAQN
jgi:WD40 repeat protein